MWNKVLSVTSMLGRHANEELSPRILWGIFPRITLALTVRHVRFVTVSLISSTRTENIHAATAKAFAAFAELS